VLVYGDHSERADVRERLGALAGEIASAATMAPGIDRHAKLVGALVEAGQLLQGAADARLGAAGQLNDFVYALASAVMRSWDSRFAEFGALPTVPRIDVDAEVELRLPEGFAFYAVYPEAYVEAARRLRLVGLPCVIGIRSIGTTLGAVVAAALGAPPPMTVRPFGNPFAREVELPSHLIEADAHYIMVDEGPGLSGSSFGAVADQLESRGVPLERIAFLPSHDGDLGPHASDAHRARWRAAQRVPAQFDPTFLRERFGALTPFSTGSPGERVKFLAQLNGERVLLKFAGLGSIGERKLDMARALYAAGFTPEPLGLVHGFLVERWCDRAQPLGPEDKPVEAIGRYIGSRARLFPACPASGASIEELLRMSRRNIGLVLGETAAEALDRWNVESLAQTVVRVRTDNKLDRHEWLRGEDKRLIKTDALDHHQAHDLIGCQDPAWDVAGATVEFALACHECEQLVDATGLPIDRQLLEFYSVAYCSFRLGLADLAGANGEAERYSTTLRDLLHLYVGPATRLGSSVDGRPERTAAGTNPSGFG
jgi:hypothetical protein